MKNILLTVIMALMGFYTIAQDHERNSSSANEYIENDLHTIRQIKGGENAFKELLISADIEMKSDTFYTILLPPMVCSRCEGTIQPFIHELKDQDPAAEVIIIAYYPRKEALRMYLENRNYKADHILASTDDSFLKSFRFSSGTIQAPYILKMTGSGEMLFGKSTLGMDMDEHFVGWIIACSNVLPKVPADKKEIKQDSIVADIYIQSLDKITLKPDREILITENSEHPISKCLYPALSNDLSHYAFMDELTFNIEIYKLSGNIAYFYTTIKPKPSVERMFIHEDINDSLYFILKKMNIVNTMFFGSSFLGDTLIVSASLPNIFFQDEMQEELAYYNTVSYLYYDINSGELMKNITPQLSEYAELTRDHTNTEILNNGRYFFIPVSKGWPVSGHEMLDQAEIEDNPFRDGFYDNCPLYSVYDDKGNFINYIGRLDPYFEKKCLGYSYANPMAAYNDGVYWIADAYSGLMEAYNDLYSPEKIAQVRIFKQNETKKIPDETNALDYIISFSDEMKTRLIDFKVIHGKIICIVRQDDYYFFRKYDMNGELIQEAFLPNQYGEDKITEYFLSKHNDEEILITGLYSSADEYRLVLFSASF